MSHNTIVDKIDRAKDSVGVITAKALHDELGSLTPADWKAAAVAFPKNTSDPDGFYITDDANGKVTIHNDMREAHDLATNSILGSTVADAESAAVAGSVLILDSVVTASSALNYLFFAPAAVASVGGLAAATVSSAVAVAEVTAVAGTVAFAGDMVRNWYRSGTAEDDLKGKQSLNA